MVKDKQFGAFLCELRKERNVTLEVLSHGLCDVGKLSRIENGQMEADKLLRDRLLGRLGVAPENYENFLYYREYKCWKERQEIVYAILYGEIEKAESLLETYKEQNLQKNPLAQQYYLSMLAQVRRQAGAEGWELQDLFRQAVGLTMPEEEKEEIRGKLLSVEEINLLLELEYYSAEHKNKEERQTWYEELISYEEALHLDKLAISKIYPKTVYYYYLFWANNGSREKKEVAKMLRLCNKAIEVLRKAKRMFYFWELLGVKQELLQLLIVENKEKGEMSVKKLKEWYAECARWRETLGEVYDTYGISRTIQEYCYLYVDMEAHCIGDVVRIRRKMLGMTMLELSEGICSERTISRLERNLTEPRREIVRLLFKRLHMAMDFCKSDLLTEKPEAKKLFAEAKQSCNRREYDKSEELLKQVKAMISLEVPENRQAIRRSEIVNENNKKFHGGIEIDKKRWISQIKEVLEYTIPYEIAVASREKYLTQSELTCLQNLASKLTWDDSELGQCIQSLYELFEHQRKIEECLAAYEFVMRMVVSKLGNRGEYGVSDAIELKILKHTLLNRRLGVISSGIYALLWNDEQRKKEQHQAKRGAVAEKELFKCIQFSYMCGDDYRIPFYKRKMEEGM